jgi:hypothetical protein
MASTTTTTTTAKACDFKKHVLEYESPKFFIAGAEDMPPTNLRHMGVFIMTRVIPSMDAHGDVAFAWHFAGKDITVYNQNEYTMETTTYRKKYKMVVNKGDTTWFFDFKNKDGKQRRCIMTTEIWFKKDEDFATSPIALLFGQMFGAGLHITKCRFEDV